MNSVILAIETSTSACSAALLVEQKAYSLFEIAERKHTQLILPMVASLLETANITLEDVTAIAVGQGPGSFTGVRIALSVAQGLSFGLNIPIYPVSTLAALAMQSPNETLTVSALDARMGEIYAGVYEHKDERVECIVQDKLMSISEFFDLLKHYPVYFVPPSYPNAMNIAKIAQNQIRDGNMGVSAIDARPVYLRENVAQKMQPKSSHIVSKDPLAPQY